MRDFYTTRFCDKNADTTVYMILGQHRYDVNENQTTQIKRERYMLL